MSGTKHKDVVWKAKPKSDESLDKACCSQNDKASVIGETDVKDLASAVDNIKLKTSPLDEDDGDSKEVRKVGDKSPKSGDNRRSGHRVLDICPKNVDSGVKLKPSLLAMNKKRRNQKKQSENDDWKLKPKSDESLDNACTQNDKASVTGETDVKDLASAVDHVKLKTSALDEDDGDSKEVKQVGDKSPKSSDNGRSNHRVFDICPKKVSSGVKLNASLLVTNREKRNQKKQSENGPKITILKPGMVLMKGYISSEDQIGIVKTCRDHGKGPGGFYQPGYGSKTKLHLQMMCLGKNWDPESRKYTDTRAFDDSKPPGIPENFRDIVKKAIQDSNEFIRVNGCTSDERRAIPSMTPDICIVNFYTKTGRLGLHQDKDESEASLKEGLPVVSFSIGGSAEFLYGETRDVDKAEKVTLESGDVLIFGGQARMIYHGVASVNPDTAPKSLTEATDMLPGRLNLTFRMY